MKKFVLCSSACAFVAFSLLIGTLLVRDSFVLAYRKAEVIHFNEISILEKGPLGKNGYDYLLSARGRVISASGNLSEGSRLIPSLQLPFTAKPKIDKYSIINSIWGLTALRLGGLGLTCYGVWVLTNEIRKRK